MQGLSNPFFLGRGSARGQRKAAQVGGTSSSEYVGVLPGSDNADISMASIEFALRTRFADVPEVILWGDPCKYDFHDDEWRDRPAIKLYLLTDPQIISLGEAVMPALQTGASLRVIAAIFLLAYQLRGPGVGITDRVFGSSIAMETVEDKPYNEFDADIRVGTNEKLSLRRSGSETEQAKAISFIAASLLRLFTRSPESYCKGWPHVCQGHQDFYSKPCPIYRISFSMDVIKWIHNQFSQVSVFKATLYRLLYHANANDNHLSLRTFLYDRDLSHTGMHIVPIFCKLREALNCETDELLDAIRAPGYKKQLSSIVKVLEYINDTGPAHKRQMWKYGRIFDHTFMKTLQTKCCPELVLILAAALRKVRPEEAGNIFNIHQLQSVGDARRKWCMRVAEEVVKMIRNE